EATHRVRGARPSGCAPPSTSHAGASTSAAPPNHAKQHLKDMIDLPEDRRQVHKVVAPCRGRRARARSSRHSSPKKPSRNKRWPPTAVTKPYTPRPSTTAAPTRPRPKYQALTSAVSGVRATQMKELAPTRVPSQPNRYMKAAISAQ